MDVANCPYAAKWGQNYFLLYGIVECLLAVEEIRMYLRIRSRHSDYLLSQESVVEGCVC